MQTAPSDRGHFRGGFYGDAEHNGPGCLYVTSAHERTYHDNTTGLVLHGAGAAGAAPQLIAAGHSVDLGLMQVNSMNLGLLGLSVSDAFTACRSVEAAAKLLALFSRYNTGSPQRGIANGYAAKVQARMDGVRGVAPANAADPAAAASQLTLRSQLASFTTTRQK